MGLLQKACETYDCMEHLAGVEVDKKETLAPVSHLMTRAQLEITLDQQGHFLLARAVNKQEAKIAIPATEDSAGRTSAPCAHPLCDQLGYLSPCFPEKHRLYLQQLTGWVQSAFSHPKLQAVLNYVQGRTILQDLVRCGLIRLKPDGSPEDEKLLVRWVVNGLGEALSGPCWTDKTLIKAFIEYYAAKRSAASSSLCMILGELQPPAAQHPKGIIPKYGNAKLISANDQSGFTYRGRFDSEEQAATAGYTSSQKAHNALRWLAVNEGVDFGGRTFLCWNPQGHPLPPVTGSMRRRHENGQRASRPAAYRRQLQQALCGWRKNLPPQAGVVIAAFDAATTGRLSVTYYHELLASDFLQRLHDWEKSCCWENGSLGIQPPSLFQLVNWAFGTPRGGRPEADPRILRQQLQRLVACRVDCAPFPLDIEQALVQRASNLVIYEEYLRQELLFAACAAIRKYRFDYLKEEWDMALDKENTNPSYLFGRLLAVADMVERSAYGREETRETNAMRMQKAFALRPLSGWRMLEERLQPYYMRLPAGLRQYYRRITQEITDKLSASQGNLNQKLEDIYLLGYYHQHACRSEREPGLAPAGEEINEQENAKEE